MAGTTTAKNPHTLSDVNLKTILFEYFTFYCLPTAGYFIIAAQVNSINF